MFQFQTGAIKRPRLEVNVTARVVRFNSKRVRLKVERLLEQWEVGHLRFNSKLVRLKDVLFPFLNDDMSMFQFQTGAIKSKFAWARQAKESSVSIPNWCD